MSEHAKVRAGPALPADAMPRTGAHQIIQWVATKNPFYVLSAGLFLAGLWLSFGAQAAAGDTWALFFGLAGYTLLLAVTACFLVRLGNVWDDVRTVLLLVVLMFLATSVTFDGVLATDQGLGFICYVGGLLMAVLVSEGILHGIRLHLPAWFRGPYYLILALFFLYPLAVAPLLTDPRSETVQWGLFGFSTVAGLIFLTLLPAIRRGPDYVQTGGSPWRWPLYPWIVFGLLALAVPARAALLCWSLHWLEFTSYHRFMFGLYFLVPFGLACAVLLLEMGLVTGRRGLVNAALAVPAGLLLLCVMRHRSDPIYQGFLEIFAARLGGYPLFLSLLATIGFYIYAALRRIPLADEALTAALLALSVVGPDSLHLRDVTAPGPWPILLASALQLGLGLCRRDAVRSLAGAGGLVVVTAMLLPETPVIFLWPVAFGVPPMVFHLALLAVLGIGALFDDRVSRGLRSVGSAAALLACLAVIFVPYEHSSRAWPRLGEVYPLVMAALLACYGQLLGNRPALGAAVLAPTCWAISAARRGYAGLRQFVTGIDYIALALAAFVLAIGISLAKAGVLSRWLARWRAKAPAATE